MASKRNSESSDHPLSRTAINSFGRPGFLYDGYRDCVLEPLNMKSEGASHHQLRSNRCDVIEGTHDQSQNPLKINSIEQELRLSILLNLTNKTGIDTIIDYLHPINEYTRFFRYSYLDREEVISNNPRKIEVVDELPLYVTDATHVITQVCYGVDFIVILQLPNNPSAAVEIHRVLNKLCSFLLDDKNTHTLNVEDEKLLERIVRTKVCSNIPDILNITTIYAVYRYIKQNKNNTTNYAIFYTLRPIKWLYRQFNDEVAVFISLPSELNNSIEQYVLQLMQEKVKLETSITEIVPKLSGGYLTHRLPDLQKKWLDVNQKYKSGIECIAKLVIDARRGRVPIPTMDQVFNDNAQILIKNSVRDLTHNLSKLQEESHSIYVANQQHVQYHNANDHIVDRKDADITTKRESVTNDKHDRILYSNTFLKTNREEQSHQVPTHLFEEHEKNAALPPAHANYTSFPSNSSSTIILPSPKAAEKDLYSHISSASFTLMQPTSAPQSEPQRSILPFTHVSIPNILSSLPPESTDETINILLLGETGVGKSTFINAFANYLTFNTLHEAQAGQPVVLMPVSFLITIGHNFQERTVKFGAVDSTNNEDFDHPGQSVTQRCKSHVFQLKGSMRKKLCIIDTPGFGDTRGLDQDDRNMQHILEYINNLSHLNAICFLLKPNASRLNIFFRSCFTQLFGLLGSNTRNNIIFCFTNARSTFYTPGDTAPLIKSMLTSLSIGDVPFKKDNTFCFDNEAFRYLVALQNCITFDDDQRKEYDMSWINSVKEAIRLISFIQNIPIVTCMSNNR